MGDGGEKNPYLNIETAINNVEEGKLLRLLGKVNRRIILA